MGLLDSKLFPTIYALVIIIGLISLGINFNLWYEDKLTKEEILNEEMYLNGTIAGANYVYETIMSKVGQCEPFPVRYKNQTVNLILAECNEGGENNE